jgi:hypothetical protein
MNKKEKILLSELKIYFTTAIIALEYAQKYMSDCTDINKSIELHRKSIDEIKKENPDLETLKNLYISLMNFKND